VNVPKTRRTYCKGKDCKKREFSTPALQILDPTQTSCLWRDRNTLLLLHCRRRTHADLSIVLDTQHKVTQYKAGK
ncbi:MAG: hypothetical protein Q9192_008986, partial [Flavoplaca navasiana]